MTAAADRWILASWQLYISWCICIETLYARYEPSCSLTITYMEKRYVQRWKDTRPGCLKTKNSQHIIWLCVKISNYLHLRIRIGRVKLWRMPSELFYAKSHIWSAKLYVADLKPRNHHSSHLLLSIFFPSYLLQNRTPDIWGPQFWITHSLHAYRFLPELFSRSQNCNSIAF